LGPARGSAAVGLYTLLGLAGLPIFSQGRSGLGILAGPSAGYIIAFPIAAGVVGWLATVVIKRTTKARALWFFVAATATSIVVVHSLGILGIALNSKATLEQAFLGDLVFYPGDIIKNVLAAAIAVALHRAFPDVLVRRARRRTAASESA
jgi:biotin transport system substrate-specific component